jgi:spore maturation protein CgeB
LFEAAACGAAVLTDVWEGLDTFYRPGAEMIFCRTTADVLASLELSDVELGRIARAARERTLAEHTAAHRAAELESIMEEAACGAARA